MKLRAWLASELATLGWACGRVSHEMRDMRVGRQEGLRWFDMVFYLRPLTRREFEAFTLHLNRRAGRGPGSEREVAVRPPRETVACLMQVEAPTADSAAMRGLALIRDALADTKIRTDVVRFEVEERDAAPVPA